MMRTTLSTLLPVLVAACAAGSVAGCTARAIEFDETTASTADDGDDQGTATAGTAGTTATTTGVPTPPETSTGPGTTGPDPTDTGPDPSTTDPTDSGPWFDVMEPPDDPWPDFAPDECASSWGPGTWIEGVSPWADFFGNRAWSAAVDPWQPGMLRVVILGKNANVALNIEEAEQTGLPQTGPALLVDTFFPYPEWFGVGEFPATMIEDGNTAPVTVRADVFDRFGNWNEWDPDDPPRVRGNLSWVEGEPFGFEGQFDAAYCGAFGQF